MPEKKYLKESIKLGERELTVETGRVAKQGTLNDLTLISANPRDSAGALAGVDFGAAYLGGRHELLSRYARRCVSADLSALGRNHEFAGRRRR